jgi:hypothetical protein
MPCSNSSNINVKKTYVTVTNGGSRLMITIPDSKCSSGITYGSVIRYDPIANANVGQYRLSTANSISTSEVVGIVESINTDNSKNVVIYGSINLPASAIEDIPVGYDGGSGGSDIYFLSPTSSGKLRNSAPTNLQHIIKPIYQSAPHGNGSYTGVVMNYIGYKIDGADLSSASQSFTNNTFVSTGNIIDPDANSGIGLIKFMLVDTELNFTIPDTFVDMRTSHLLPLSDYPDYFNTYGYYESVYTYGSQVASLSPPSKLFVEHAITDSSTHTVNSSNVGKYIFRQGVTTYYVKIIGIDPVNNAYLLTHNSTTYSANVTRTNIEQPTWNYGICNNIGDTTSVAGFFKFSTVSPYGYNTPVITFNASIYDVSGNTNNLNFQVIPLLKVKKDVNAGASFVENNTFRTTTLEINNENVNYILDDFETRLQALETRLLIT